MLIKFIYKEKAAGNWKRKPGCAPEGACPPERKDQTQPAPDGCKIQSSGRPEAAGRRWAGLHTKQVVALLGGSSLEAPHWIDLH